jgi:hypothetical protein
MDWFCKSGRDYNNPNKNRWNLNWCDIGRSNGWYTDNQLKLLSRANVNDS